VGLISDVTGIDASIFAAENTTAEAAIAAANAAGGVNGYHINYKVYDAQGSPAGGLTAARQAVGDHPFAVIAGAEGITGGLATLNAAKLPTVGDGVTPGWSNAPNLFSISGNVLSQNTTAAVHVLIERGLKKIAIPGGTLNPGVVTIFGHIVTAAGGTVCFQRVGIDATNTASVTAVAHQIISAGCQGVASPTLYPGTLQLQIALNQLGAHMTVVDFGDYGPAVVQQAGASADGLVFAGLSADLYDNADPGVAQYLADMKKYEPNTNPYCGPCMKGYISAKWFLHALGDISGPVTQENLVSSLNSTNGYTVDGLVGPITEPAFHSIGTVCLSYSQIQHGQWTPLINGPFPFYCGKAVVG
jgi:ABC-type branched-subunit amino acid transport system substrate-binding protein